MATFEQWVNFPVRDGDVGGTDVSRSDFVDDDIASVHRMGRRVYVSATFRRRYSGSFALLRLIPDTDNATYSLSEKTSNPGVFTAGSGAARISRSGRARFCVLLTPAGGDKFKFEASTLGGQQTVECRTEFETRRKLFYQLIKMRRARKITSRHGRRFRNRFWLPAHKLYLRLEEIAPGGRIPNMVNFDDTNRRVKRRVMRQARRVYNDSKKPFSIAVIFVNRNCIPGVEASSGRVNNSGSILQLSLTNELFHFADPSQGYYNRLTWTADSTGRTKRIPPSKVTVVDMYTVNVDIANMARGPGLLRWSFKVVDIIGMGLSLSSENLCTVASRSLTGNNTSKEMLDVIIHETGHKIGMVPGPAGDPDLDQQSTYYSGRGHSGGHCRFPAPLLPNYMNVATISPAPSCVMFGDTRTHSDRFCRHCRRSVRKLDVSPSRKQGLSNQF